ncbi:MAG: Rpn family recombination-promoting nuclease/putative transposase, partial [Bacilli bacterium]
MQRLNPMNDFIFKKIFGESDGKHRLLSFLNAVLEPSLEKEITDVEVIDNATLTPETVDEKAGILDVRAWVSDGTIVNIEVQLTNQGNIEKRALWNWSRIFYRGIKKGEDYVKLPRVISIFLVDFKLLPVPKYHSIFNLREKDYHDCILTNTM